MFNVINGFHVFEACCALFSRSKIGHCCWTLKNLLDLSISTGTGRAWKILSLRNMWIRLGARRVWIITCARDARGPFLHLCCCCRSCRAWWLAASFLLLAVAWPTPLRLSSPRSKLPKVFGLAVFCPTGQMLLYAVRLSGISGTGIK